MDKGGLNMTRIELERRLKELYESESDTRIEYAGKDGEYSIDYDHETCGLLIFKKRPIVDNAEHWIDYDWIATVLNPDIALLILL